MAFLERLRRLPPARRRLLLPAVGLVASTRVALWLFPYGRVRRWLEVAPARDGSPPGDPANEGNASPTSRPAPDDVVWAVSTVARRVPRATCLTQALVAHRLLTRAGYPVEVRIGVARQDDGGFEAHAWLEHDGRIVLGELEDMTRFVRVQDAGDGR